MAIVIETFIICDGCGENTGIDNRHLTGKEQRSAAKINGWVYSSGKDYCPNCKKSKKQEPSQTKI